MPVSHRRIGGMGLVAIAAFALAAPATAADDLTVSYAPEAGTVTRTIKVDVSDLQLGTTHGRTLAKARITRAAQKVCDYNGGYGLRQPKDYTRCFDEARNEAMSSPRLIQTASLN